MRVIVKIGIVLAAASVAVVTYAAVSLYRANTAGTQIRNFVQLQIHCRALEDYRRDRGEYPQALKTAVAAYRSSVGDRQYLDGLDHWGNPLLFTTDGAHFVLISLGRDGRADGRSIPALGTPPGSEKTSCADNTLDTVITEAGVHRGCFK